MKTYAIEKDHPSFNLLTQMLAIDPKKRISCEAALNHKYFTEAPKPMADVFSGFGKGNLPFPRRKYMEVQKIDTLIAEPKIKHICRKTLQERNV